MSIFQVNQRPHDYLLIPVMPTPNGGLHLGHMSGPYLKMDVLARHLERRGDRVKVVFATDSHDSFVLLKSHQSGGTPEEVALDYHRRICRDLEALQVRTDVAFSPLESEWADLYRSSFQRMMLAMIESDSVEVRKERFLYSPRNDRYIVGCWLLGKCPFCGCPAGSYFCEECGGCFRAEQILDPRPRLDEGPLEWREVRCLHLRIGDQRALFEKLSAMGVPADFLAIAQNYLERQGPTLRLTHPGQWGVEWRVPGEPTRQVVFSYGAMLPFSIVCGEIHKRLTGSRLNALAAASSVTVVASFGIDNSVPFLIGVVGEALAWRRFKAPDAYLLNHFYELEGSKFSTSRQHVIWPSEIVAKTAISIDGLRLYLVRNNPERGGRNFEVEDFLKFSNEILAGEWRSALSDALDRIESEPSSGERVAARLEERLKKQDAALNPLAFRLSDSAQEIDAWIAEAANREISAYWWLKGFALLAYPCMPLLSSELWRFLGHSDRPCLSSFLAVKRPLPSLRPRLFKPVSFAEISLCLPERLAESRV